jgi:type III secretion protein U
MSEGGEKNRPPTAKRLHEAKQQGQVAQTPSIPHLLAAAGTFELLAATSDHWLSQAPMLLGSFLERLGSFDSSQQQAAVWDFSEQIFQVGLVTAIGALVFASVLAFIGNVIQTGFMVAPDAILRFERLDPIGHLKGLFDTEQMSMMLMNTVKLITIIACTGVGILMSINSLLRIGDGTLVQAGQAVLQMFVLCERLTMAVLLILVVLDWVIRRHSHIKSLRMSREEVEAEQKDQFGDKHVRAKRNEFRRDLLAGELTENTRKANAVVTNPTHFAVAMFYDPSQYPLPVVLARGADEGAALMRKVARDAGIPVIRSAQLARTLYSVGREWHPIPRITLKAVAAVYRVVARMHRGELSIDDLPDLTEGGAGHEDGRRTISAPESGTPKPLGG